MPDQRLPAQFLALIAAGPVIRALTVVWLRTINDNPDFLSNGAYSLTSSQFDAFAIGAAIALFADKLSQVGDRAFLAATGILLACGQLNALAVNGTLAPDTTLHARRRTVEEPVRQVYWWNLMGAPWKSASSFWVFGSDRSIRPWNQLSLVLRMMRDNRPLSNRGARAHRHN